MKSHPINPDTNHCTQIKIIANGFQVFREMIQRDRRQTDRQTETKTETETEIERNRQRDRETERLLKAEAFCMLDSAQQDDSLSRRSLDCCCGSHRLSAQSPSDSNCARNPDGRHQDGLDPEDGNNPSGQRQVPRSDELRTIRHCESQIETGLRQDVRVKNRLSTSRLQ